MEGEKMPGETCMYSRAMPANDNNDKCWRVGFLQGDVTLPGAIRMHPAGVRKSSSVNNKRARVLYVCPFGWALYTKDFCVSDFVESSQHWIPGSDPKQQVIFYTGLV
ncbi:unnamed protein product [Lepidochelys olivacea]